MDIGYFKDLAIGVGSLVTAFSLFTAGVIFLWKREWRARLKLSIDVDAFCKVGESFLIEPVCVVENVGLLRSYIYSLDFSVRYVLPNDKLVKGDEKKLLKATIFPGKAVSTQLIKEDWGWSYVEAGIEHRFSTVTHIPKDAVAVLVWVKLYHKKAKDDFFTAQRVFVIENGKLITD
jgi:hypothetical protein